MKKFPLIISMLMIAAMALAACGGAGDTTSTPGIDTPPGTGGLETPVVGDTDPVIEEPTVDLMDQTPTADAAMETPTVDMAETPATGDLTTPTADGSTGSVPVTGDDDCNPNSLQGLLDMDVVDSTGMQIGDVNSVIVLRDANAAPMGTGTDAGQTTPAADDAAAQVTPAAGDTGAVVAMAAPQVAYLVLDLEDNDNNVVVPFQAFDLTVKSQGVGGTDDTMPAADATLDPAATPAAGTTPMAEATTVVGDMANEAVVCAITLQNVQADAFASAPVFGDDLDVSVTDWDSDIRTYWSGEGLSIPVTGDANLGAAVVLDDEFNNINARNNNGDGLGEVEDFILDKQTGTFTYAVLAAGGFLGIGEKYIPVPINQVQWVSEEAGDNGEVVINISDDEWQNVPSFDSSNEFNTSTEGWDTDLRNFWDGLDGSTTD